MINCFFLIVICCDSTTSEEKHAHENFTVSGKVVKGKAQEVYIYIHYIQKHGRKEQQKDQSTFVADSISKVYILIVFYPRLVPKYTYYRYI